MLIRVVSHLATSSSKNSIAPAPSSSKSSIAAAPSSSKSSIAPQIGHQSSIATAPSSSRNSIAPAPRSSKSSIAPALSSSRVVSHLYLAHQRIVSHLQLAHQRVVSHLHLAHQRIVTHLHLAHQRIVSHLHLAHQRVVSQLHLAHQRLIRVVSHLQLAHQSSIAPALAHQSSIAPAPSSSRDSIAPAPRSSKSSIAPAPTSSKSSIAPAPSSQAKPSAKALTVRNVHRAERDPHKSLHQTMANHLLKKFQMIVMISITFCLQKEAKNGNRSNLKKMARLKAAEVECEFVPVLECLVIWMASFLSSCLNIISESTRSAVDIERVPDFLELVFEELSQFAQRREIAEEYDRRNSRGSLEHDELEEQRRRERSDYHRSPRRRLSHSISTEDPTLDLDILQPVRIRSSPKDSPMSPMRGMADPEEMRSYQRTERVKVHRRRHSKHIIKEAEREERRRLRRSRDSVESSKSVDSLEVSISPKKDIGELESSGENKTDIQQKEFDTSLLNSESVGDLHSSREAKVSEDLERKPEDSIITQDAARIADTLLSSVEQTITEYPEMKSLGSSISSLSFDSPSDFQCSEASATSEISKNEKEPNLELPSTGSGTSISSEVDQVITAQKPDLSLPRSERNITPEGSSTPSDELPTSIEENPPTDDAHNTGAKPKSSQKCICGSLKLRGVVSRSLLKSNDNLCKDKLLAAGYAGLSGDQDNGYSSLENENDAGPTQQTPAVVIDAALSRLRARANCEEDSFVRHLSTSLLSRMARNIFRRWESTRSAVDIERVPDFLELVFEELSQFAQRREVAEEYERRNSRGSLEHDELEEQRRRERGDYHRSPRRRLSHSISTEDPTLDLDILRPVRIRSSPKDSPVSPMREREERRRLRRSRDSVESSESVDSLELSISPKKDIGELESSGENKSDIQQKEFDTSLLNSEYVGELHSSREAKVSEDLERKPEDSIITQDAARIADTLLSSVEQTSTEYQEMKSLGSSISSMSFDSPSDFQCSEASATSEISKNDKEPNSELPSTGSGTSISSDVDQVIIAQKPELSHPRTVRNITPEESSTPSDELPTSIEENPPTDDAHNTGARPKSSQKDKGRRKKRTRQVVESLTNRQIASLTRLEITTTDALELLIQLSVSLDRLDRLINGSRSRESDIVNESVLAQFFEGLEYCRTRAEMANRVPVEGRDDSQSSSVPEITEHPLRDPKDNA
ncbi:hypothetical protein JTE90_010713 [Oedothorax gibbosus]|uniref:Uncharacterized protein n=1 Tax=Oedothorax gibbosus TaxID=931172 RepID=A0AAV6URK9_9ARAC|nr:hypothetical protein JTE90_010713 [Oedothorax gibbosus]